MLVYVFLVFVFVCFAYIYFRAESRPKVYDVEALNVKRIIIRRNTIFLNIAHDRSELLIKHCSSPIVTLTMHSPGTDYRN